MRIGKSLKTLNASTGFSPFQTVDGYQPDTYGSLVLNTQKGHAYYDWLKDRADIQKLVTTNLVEAKLFREHYANRRVREAEMHEGDRVALRTEGLRLQGQPSSMLKQRFLGPFEIIEKLSPLVYKLKLPKGMKIHPVVHIFYIKLIDGATPPKPRVYKMSPAELAYLKVQLETYLGKGFIRPSRSAWAAPVLFARKPDGSLRKTIVD